MRPRRRMPHPRKCCLSNRGKKIPEPSSPRIRREGKGKGVVFRSGKDLRASLSSADNYEHNQGERASPWSARECQEHHERNGSPAVRSVESRTPMMHMTQQFPSNQASGGEESGEAATPQCSRSPFVAGGPLCAEYPSYWTATGVSALNTVDPRPLVAWTTATAAEKQQKFPASGPVPREGGFKRRGLGTPPSRRTSANRSKHRCTEVVARLGCSPLRMDVEHHHKNRLKTSAICDVSQDPPVNLRASSALGRCTTYSTVDRGVGRRPLLPHEGVTRRGHEISQGPQEAFSMCFGRYMVLIG